MKLHPLPARHLTCGRHRLDLSRPQVMGILNVTPDSFSDGGAHLSFDAALRRAETMLAEGASIIDIGGESTRPNASPVSLQEELDRVVPVVEAITQSFDTIVSIDTSTPEVFRAAAGVGATLWNDVRALSRPGALETASQLGLPVVIMHMRGEPGTMNSLAQYTDVVTEVHDELRLSLESAVAAGIGWDKIIVDVGLGFAKDAKQNLTLLAHLTRFHELGFPMMLGISRKRVLGEVLNEVLGNNASMADRLYPGLAAALMGVQQGVSIIRTHDVGPTVAFLAMHQALSAL